MYFQRDIRCGAFPIQVLDPDALSSGQTDTIESRDDRPERPMPAPYGQITQSIFTRNSAGVSRATHLGPRAHPTDPNKRDQDHDTGFPARRCILRDPGALPFDTARDGA